MKKLLFLIFGILIATIAAAQFNQTRTLKVGDSVPDVTLKTINDTDFSLNDSLKDKPLVIIFYRANWCPYCNEHLSDLQSYENPLIKLGYKVVAISTESFENLQKTKQQNYLKYMLLSDENKEAIKLFGVENGSVAIPSVFITDKNHVIRFVHSNPDYKTRLSGEEVYNQAKEIVSIK